MRRSPQEENGIIFSLNMSGEMHMQRHDEVFGCIPDVCGVVPFVFKWRDIYCNMCRAARMK